MSGVTCKQLNLSGAYDYKGGDTSRVAYPTVESVRQEFYRTYPGVEDFDSSRGEIPIVGRTVFREHIVKAGFKFVKCRGNNRSYITSRMDVAVDRLSYLRDIMKYVHLISPCVIHVIILYIYIYMLITDCILIPINHTLKINMSCFVVNSYLMHKPYLDI